MRTLDTKELDVIAGGIKCTLEGIACSHCAGTIWIDGDDCGILKAAFVDSSGSFDTGGFAMSLASGWVGLVVSYAAASAFGLSGIASGGIAFAVGAGIAAGYASTQMK